jgi:hypothetical protein
LTRIFTAARTVKLLPRRIVRANASLGAIDELPFYGVEFTDRGCVGQLADGNGQVIHQRRYPIPGLSPPAMLRPPRSMVLVTRPAVARRRMTPSYLAGRHMIDSA